MINHYRSITDSVQENAELIYLTSLGKNGTYTAYAANTTK